MNLHHNLTLAIHASEQACKEILSIYNSDNFFVEAKDDNSPLTKADKKSHECIVEILRSTGIPVLSEEGRDIPYEERKHWKYFWMVDPLDGTKEFIKRNGEFTVNIALIENHLPVLGVVAVPVSGQVFYGARSLGAFVKKDNLVKPLVSRKNVELTGEGIRVVASRSHLNEETLRFIESLNKPVLVSKGSSLKFMLLADGEADVYPRFAPTMEWDTAAAHAIVNQVGISVRQKDSSQELTYNKENLLNPPFLCR
jgi:3'(2'), 5'-bisphosphate nucleotidase